MKRISLAITRMIFMYGVWAQSTDTPVKKQLYDPSDDAKVEIAEAVKKAGIEIGMLPAARDYSSPAHEKFTGDVPGEES